MTSKDSIWDRWQSDERYRFLARLEDAIPTAICTDPAGFGAWVVDDGRIEYAVLTETAPETFRISINKGGDREKIEKKALRSLGCARYMRSDWHCELTTSRWDLRNRVPHVAEIIRSHRRRNTGVAA